MANRAPGDLEAGKFVEDASIGQQVAGKSTIRTAVFDTNGNANSSDYPLTVDIQNIVGHLDSGNSTSTPLGIDGVFTGTSRDIQDCGVVQLAVYSDVASATDGLDIQFSTDGINWDHSDVFTIAASTGKTFSFQPVSKYFRVVYTNGGIAQTEFRLQIICKSTYVKPSSHRVADNIVSQDDAELVKAVITGESPSGDFINVGVTANGSLKIDNISDGLSIASGKSNGLYYIHKFGEAIDIDVADGFVDIWDGMGIATKILTYTFSTSADIDSISSDNATDTQTITIEGLDSNWLEVSQTITLNGQTRVPLTTNLIRINRMFNDGATDLAGNVYCYVNTAIVTGKPTDETKIRAIIYDGNNQTLMSVYSVPSNKTAYMMGWYASLSRDKVVVNDIHLKFRDFGGVFKLKHTMALNSAGSGTYQHEYRIPEKILSKTDIIMQSNSTANDSGVSAGFELILEDN